MRLAPLACCLALALAAAGCGADDEQSAGAGVDPDQPISSPADPSPPAGEPTSPRKCRRLARGIVGDPLEQATERAERHRCTLRVAVLDGEGQVLTEDFQPARINVRVEDGVVPGLEFMG
jgi:hypothetical protein